MEEVLFLNARKWLDIQETRCQIWLSGLYSTQVYCAMHHSDGEDSVVNNQIRVWFFREVTCQRKTQTKTSKDRSQMMIWAPKTEQGEGARESERKGCFCFTLGGQESLTDCVIVSVLYSADAKCRGTEGQWYYAILYKGLKHLRILLSARGPETNPPHGGRGVTVCKQRPGERGKLLSLPIQMLISSGNTLTDTPRNNV